jgi:alpha-glucosidase
MLLLTLPGTLTMYYGEELGMTNVPIAPEQVQDLAEKNEPGLGQGRDPERTPMPWDGSRAGGFTTGSPWLPLGDDHSSFNVDALEQDRSSILHLYRRLIDLRRSRPAWGSGKLQFLTVESDVLSFQRIGEQESLLVLLNMGHELKRVELPCGVVLVSTYLDREGQAVNKALDIRAAEGVVISLDMQLEKPSLIGPES